MARFVVVPPVLRTSASSLHLLFTILGLASITFGQSPKVLAPHKPIAPRVDKPIRWQMPAKQRSTVGGLWMTGPDFKSSIYVRNVVETDPITVTPILFLSNGARYSLSALLLRHLALQS